MEVLTGQLDFLALFSEPAPSTPTAVEPAQTPTAILEVPVEVEQPDPGVSDPFEQTIGDGLNIITYIADLADEPVQRLWQVPPTFSLPTEITDRRLANARAIALVLDLRDRGEEPTNDEKLVLAGYTGGVLDSSMFAGPGSEYYTGVESVKLTIESFTLQSRQSREILDTVSAATEHSIEILRSVANKGCKAAFLACEVPALPSLVSPAFTTNTRATFHTTDPIAYDIAGLLHENLDRRGGTLDGLDLGNGSYDFATLFAPIDSLRRTSYGHQGETLWGDTNAIAPTTVSLANCVRSEGLGVFLLDTRFTTAKTFESKGKQVRPAVARAAFFENQSIIGIASTSVPVATFQRRSGPPLEDCDYLDGLLAEKSLDLPASFSSQRLLVPDVQLNPYYLVGDAAVRESADMPSVALGNIEFDPRDPGNLIANPLGIVRSLVFENSVSRERMVGLVRIRDLTNELQRAIALGDRSVAETHQQDLNVLYDEFTTVFGPVNAPENRCALTRTVDLAKMRSLEVWSGNVWGKSALLTEELTIVAPIVPTTPQEALRTSFKTLGHIDLEHAGSLIGITGEEAARHLAGEVFSDPATQKLVFANEYLCGDVVTKLQLARQAAATDPRFAANVTNLEAVQPDRVPIENIAVSPGAPWLPPSLVQEFSQATFGRGVQITKSAGKWSVSVGAKTTAASSRALTETFAVKDGSLTVRNGAALLRTLLTSGGASDILVDDGKGKKVYDERLTLIANEKCSMLRDEFSRFIRDNPSRSALVEEAYNSTINRFARSQPDAGTLALAGFSHSIEPKAHQLNAVARGLADDSLCLNHFTGAGKTFVIAALANERIRRGMNDKPLLVLPRNTLLQTASEIQGFFPELPVSVIGPQAITNQDLGSAVAKAVQMPQGLTIMTFETFQEIPIAAGEGLVAASERVRTARGLLASARTAAETSKFETALKAALVDREKLVAKRSDGKEVTLSDFGFDMIEVDEAHRLRNLQAAGPAKLGHSGTRLTADFSDKLETLRSSKPNMALVFSTATVLNRSISELYSFQRYLQPEVLRQCKIETLGDWCNTFTESQPTIASKIDGTAVIRSNYTIVNAPELSTILSSCFDSVAPSDVDDVKIPTIRGGKPILEVSPRSPSHDLLYADGLRRVYALRNGILDPDTNGPVAVPPTLDNPLSIYTDMVTGAIDPRLVDASLPAPVDGKLERCANNLLGHYLQSTDIKGTQLVFIDKHRLTAKEDDAAVGVTKGDVLFSAPNELKRLCVERGIPEHEVVFVNDVPDAGVSTFNQKVRDGDVRIVIGSGKKLGTGTNIQDRVVADHHLDVPWNPADVLQRGGRAQRQGNMNDEITRYNYLTEGSGEAAVITDCARKASSFALIWRAGKSDRAIADIDSFEADLGALVSEITDSRSADLLHAKARLNSLDAKISVLDRELQLDSRNLDYYKDSIKRRDADISLRESAIAKIAAKGGFEGKISTHLEIDGQAYDDFGEACGALSKMLWDVGQKPKAIGTYGGVEIYGDQRSVYLGEDQLTLPVDHRHTNPGAVLKNLVRSIRQDLPTSVEKMKENNSLDEKYLLNHEQRRVRCEELGRDRVDSKAEYERILTDIAQNPSDRPKASAFTQVAVRHNPVLSRPRVIPENCRVGYIHGENVVNEVDGQEITISRSPGAADPIAAPQTLRSGGKTIQPIQESVAAAGQMIGNDSLQWNLEQQSFVNCQGPRIFLHAPAGSGKTAVLVERVRQLVSTGADPHAFLIVTFTNRVAAEVAQRLTAATGVEGGQFSNWNLSCAGA